MDFISFTNNFDDSLGAVPTSSEKSAVDKIPDILTKISNIVSTTASVFSNSSKEAENSQKTDIDAKNTDKIGEISWEDFKKLSKEEQKQYFVLFPNSVHRKRQQTNRIVTYVAVGAVTLVAIAGIAYLAYPKNEVENGTPKKTKAIKGLDGATTVKTSAKNKFKILQNR